LRSQLASFASFAAGRSFSHPWKAYGVLRGGRYHFNDEDQMCPRGGLRAVSAIGQTDRMIQEQRKTNFWLALLYLFRH